MRCMLYYMPKLLIVESPNKVKKIQGFLGSDWTVKASVGHIRDLPKKELGVEVASGAFTPAYEITNPKAVANLKAALASASEVYLATDPDREGEAIGWHLQQVLKLKNPWRVTFHEITAAAVKKAVAEPRRLDLNLIAAQEGRRVIDRLVGYTVSWPLTVALRRTKRFPEVRASAGRVQTPALRLVVERERAIRNFKPTDYFAVRLVFPGPDGPWWADWHVKPHLAPGVEYMTDRALAERAAAVRSVKVQDAKDGVASESPPAPFTTSTLQQSASTTLKMRPEATMKAAQELFEAGEITYIRTDSPTLSEDAVAEIRGYAASAGWPLPDKPPVYKAKGTNAQEAHEAIRPTHIATREVGGSPDAKRLYALIWARAVASQLQPAKYATRTVRLVSLDHGLPPAFGYVATSRSLIEPGWRVVFQDDADETPEDSERDAPNPVPRLAPGASLKASDGKVLSKKTRPPPRYTEAALIRALEEQGIGRPSTYAAILSNIERRGYVSVAKRALKAEPLGEAVIDELAGKFSFADLPYTAAMETRLDDVAAGKLNYRAAVSEAWGTLSRERASLPDAAYAPAVDGPPCPECGKPLRLRQGSRGPFWGCSGYPKCKVTRPDIEGKPGEASERREQAAADGPPCPECGKPLRLRQGVKGSFWGCSGYPKCKVTRPNDDGKPGERQGGAQTDTGTEGPPCPECDALTRSRTTKTGKPFYVCPADRSHGPWWNNAGMLGAAWKSSR